MSHLSKVQPSKFHPIHHIGIIGCGLMGGSIALRAMEAGFDVVVFDVHEETRDHAASLGLKVADTPGDACANRDLVLMATPVSALVPLIPMIRPYLEPNSIVSDIGSVKAPSRILISALTTDQVEVIPTHPMVGSAESGIIAANPAILDECTWLICETPPGQSSRRLALLFDALGGNQSLACPLEQHDVAVGIVSHFPQMAASLVASVAGESEASLLPGAFTVAGGGFRDTTRVADSSLSMWGPIVEENASIIAMLLRRMAEETAAIADAVERKDAAAVAQLFEQAHDARNRWRAAQPQTANHEVDATGGHQPELWTDPVSGEWAWIDQSLGWETIRTSTKDPREHGAVVAAFLAHTFDLDTGTVLANLDPVGSNARRVVSALEAAGMDVSLRETFTADGIPVGGPMVEKSRFLVIA